MLEQDIPVIFASVKEVTIMKTAVIYARVSSSNDRQNTQRQIEDLTQFASRNEYQLMGTYEEHISGATKNENRMVLMECINYCIEHQVNYLLLSELSRLGRSTLEALKVIEVLNENKVCLYLANYGLETLDKDGKVNPTCHLLCTILLEVAQMERGMIRTRMAMGYQEYLNKRKEDKENHPLGRPTKYKKSDTAYREQYAKELTLLRKGVSLRNVSKITGTSIGTLRKIKIYV